VTREALRHDLWPDGVFVDFDRAINKAVFELRRALDDGPSGEGHLIETISKRGYRIVADVRVAAAFTPGNAAGDRRADADVEYVRGRYLYNRRRVPDLVTSVTCFERTIELGGDAGRAYAALSSAHALLAIWGLHAPDKAFGVARGAAIRALRANPDLAEGHLALAEVLKGYDWSWQESEQHFQRALHLDPGCAAAHHWYAQLLACLGRHADAIRHMELARRADPVSPAITGFVPGIYLLARSHRRALREATNAVVIEPYSPLAHWMLGRAYLAAGRPDAAVATLQHASELADHASMWLSVVGYARGAAGDRAGAIEVASALYARSRREYVSPYDLAIACLGAGDRAAAIDHLEQSFDQRIMRIIMLCDPELDSLRTEPRFRRLVARLGLPRPPV
jgi:tetratricopeptide (TPR) repeat protein